MAYTKESLENAMMMEPNTGCWLSLGKATYGPTKISWKLFNGPIPDGQWVLHKCDTPACCNPKHLFLGDRRANMLDAIEKKRHNHARKTHCLRGHDFAVFGKIRFNRRYCMECDRRRWHDRANKC